MDALLSIALAVCVAWTATAGVRPYEMEWAWRTKDDRPATLPLVSADGWTCSATNAEASEAESTADFVHKMKVAMKELKESRVWLISASRLAPCEAVESLRAESKELLLMVGKSINTASARMQGKTIGA